MRYFGRFLLLVVAFALTTAGLMGWRDRDFALYDLWPVADAFGVHPLYLLILGLAMIPPALWEVFLLERNLPEAAAQGRRASATDPTAPTDGAP
jgi:hypothetical protein